METLRLIGTVIYFATLVLLSCYGLHRYWMIYLYLRHRKENFQPTGRLPELPKITVQLPLYNEMYVAERLLDAVAALDYPKDKLEVQVLDDSTDETTEIVARKVTQLCKRGFRIRHIHRTHRHGFKAGALENGLRQASGEYIAIFDADFVPQKDLLQKIIHFFTDPSVGMIQTRWGHINEQYSLLTRIQSMFLDGHFLIEQTARARSGRFFNFNGTAGVWRRSCIEASGGWHHDTLAEDLDLSYRAQIKGWQFLFLPDVVTPAELPVEMNAFKSQQHRWAKGSIQTCKKMLPLLWRSKLPLKVKFEGTVHLTSNFGYLMLLVLCVCFHAPAAAGTYQATGGNPWTKLLLVDVPLFMAASVSISAFYFCAQRELHAQWWKRLLYLPVLMAVGVGLCINNARAVLEAIFNHHSEFIRTPKYGVARRREFVAHSKYRALRGLIPYIELSFGVYFSYVLVAAIDLKQWSLVPFVLIFQGGFLYVGLMSLLQSSWRALRQPAPPELAPAGA
ncbi:MAG TPA: cellulose synthase family protein [Verrucomicrobiae bacterium]|nr:cellulose synthase family protein [Verrucomicrobiae bacterium]